MSSYIVRTNGREIVVEDAATAERWSRKGARVTVYTD